MTKIDGAADWETATGEQVRGGAWPQVNDVKHVNNWNIN